MDSITTHPDGTGTATMLSISLGREMTFDFTFEPGASDIDVAHAAGLQLVIEEEKVMARLCPDAACSG